jgi:hypothetical protein
MTKTPPRDIDASVRSRLLNLARDGTTILSRIFL